MREKASIFQSAIRLGGGKGVLLWEKEVIQPSFQLQGRNTLSVGWKRNSTGPNGRETVKNSRVGIQFSSVKYLDT